MKNAKWKMTEHRNGKNYVHKNWQIHVDNTGGGAIISRKNYAMIEKLKANTTIEKGLGIPEYVVNKSNELMNG